MTTLLPLRAEVKITRVSADGMGAPRWLLEDQVRNSFFNIDWPTYEILTRWSYADPELIVEAVNQQTTLTLTADDVEAVKKFLDMHCLVVRWETQEALGLAGRKREQQKSWAYKLMHGYLFFRLPLFNPDAFLGDFLGIGKFFLSTRFLYISLSVLAFSLLQISRQWSEFTTTFVDTLTLEGLIAYATALVFVKIIHEFGHAFALKKYGQSVPEMGVAFLVMFPMAYTDMNQAWRVSDRAKRINIATAGVRFELLVAIWSAFFWLILPDGPIKSALFFLATISWILTLFLNSSPFLRFDGYFVLMDFLNYPNLHERSAAIARWQLRKALFGDSSECPERLAPNFRRFLVVFAWITWAYRFVIFIGIALLIYFKVTKLLGIFLAAIEVYWFILKPIIKEVTYWWENRLIYAGQARARKTIALALIVAFIFFVPLPYPIKSAVIIRPTNFWDIILTQRAQVVSLPPADGETLDEGAEIGRFSSDEASYRLAIASINEAEAQRNLRNANISRDTDESYAVLLNRFEGEVSSRQSAELLGDRLDVMAPVDAIFRRQDTNLALGEWLPQLTRIGFVVPERGTVDAVAWLEADAVASISIGAPVRIFTMQSVMPWRGQVIAVSDSAASELPVTALSATHFGNVLVRPHNGVLVPEQAVYRVTIRVEGVESDDLRHVMYGNVAISSAPRSMGERYVRAIVATLAREFTP